MKKLYEKNEMTFAIVCIVVYCILQMSSPALNKAVGVDYAAYAVFNLAQSIILLVFMKQNGLFKKYGLCKTKFSAWRFLFYIPLIAISFGNLSFGAAVNLPPLECVCYLTYMLCVGINEELIFRAILFKAIAKDNVTQAIIISSVTFGLGHILHLFDGSGQRLIETLLQVLGAVAIGFMFMTLFYRGGSIIPCIITHSVNDMVSAFANQANASEKQIVMFFLIRMAICIAYTLILLKTLPNKTEKFIKDRNEERNEKTV